MGLTLIVHDQRFARIQGVGGDITLRSASRSLATLISAREAFDRITTALVLHLIVPLVFPPCQHLGPRVEVSALARGWSAGYPELASEALLHSSLLVVETI